MSKDKKFYKGYNFRFKDKEKYFVFTDKIKREEISIQDFFENAINDYLKGNYNPENNK
jgi:hypothetical protein